MFRLRLWPGELIPLIQASTSHGFVDVDKHCRECGPSLGICELGGKKLRLGAAGFIVIVILTILFGRVYCSTVCPLGTFQDVISFMARKKRKQLAYQFSEPHNVLPYSILTLTVLLLVAGSGFLLNLLDPFSSFGRIFSNLFRPIVLVVNNVAAIALEPLGVHTLYRVPWAVIAPVSAGVSMAMLMLVAMLAATRGRLYCNTVCPVGALLGLLSKISFLQVSIDPGVCKGCKLCEGVCKARCIDHRKKTVDISRCVGCTNCFAVCPREGLRFENRWERRVPAAQPDLERRDFILNRELRGLHGQHGLRRVFRALSDESGGHGAVSESGEQEAQDPGGEAGVMHRLRRMQTCVPHEALQSDLRGRKSGAQAREKTGGEEDRKEG